MKGEAADSDIWSLEGTIIIQSLTSSWTVFPFHARTGFGCVITDTPLWGQILPSCYTGTQRAEKAAGSLFVVCSWTAANLPSKVAHSLKKHRACSIPQQCHDQKVSEERWEGYFQGPGLWDRVYEVDWRGKSAVTEKISNAWMGRCGKTSLRDKMWGMIELLMGELSSNF